MRLQLVREVPTSPSPDPLHIFFSSRSRHTRYWRDWSSDVCSSDLPWVRLGEGSLVQFGYGKHRRCIQAAMAETTSGVAVEVVSDKQLTKTLLERAAIPVPRDRKSVV